MLIRKLIFPIKPAGPGILQANEKIKHADRAYLWNRGKIIISPAP
ncbi:MAG: hypothetical protein PVG45_02795 [Gammaproteobacteria bacterium]